MCLLFRGRILDTLLVEHARKSGAEVRERVKVNGVTMRDGRVAGVVCRNRKGSSEEIAGRLVVGADDRVTQRGGPQPRSGRDVALAAEPGDGSALSGIQRSRCLG